MIDNFNKDGDATELVKIKEKNIGILKGLTNAETVPPSIESLEEPNPVINTNSEALNSLILRMSNSNENDDAEKLKEENKEYIKILEGFFEGVDDGDAEEEVEISPSVVAGDNTLTLSITKRGVWVSLQIDKDPFSVSIGNECFIQAELIFHDSSTKNIQTIAIRTTPDFRLKIKGPVRTSGPKNMKVVQAALMGTVTLERIDNTTKENNTTIPIKINNSVQLEQGQLDNLLSTIASISRLDMFGKDSLVRSNRTWLKPDLAKLEVKLMPNMYTLARTDTSPFIVAPSINRRFMYSNRIDTVSTPSAAGTITRNDINLITATQTVNDEVARPDDPAHEASLQALEILGTALKDRSFASSRAQMLFPPIPADQPAYVVQATHDWVLFHRRRDKPCHADSPVSPELRRRGYRVYFIQLQESDNAGALREYLHAGNIDSSFHPEMISYVEFDATTSVLRNGFDSLGPAWETAVANILGVDTEEDTERKIIYRAIANGNAWEDGETLTLSRLNQLTNIIDEVTELDQDADADILPGIPLGLNGLREDEGVVLFAF